MLKSLFKTSAYAVFLWSTLWIAACAHQAETVVSDDADAIFQEAEELAKDERYLLAIEKYRDIKNRFPYSRRATDAELRIADAYFDMESYLEAESAYEIFRELHPAHPQADYVQYRVSLSFTRLIPSDTARDLSAAYRAIDAYQMLLNKFPNSKYAAEAKKGIEDAYRKLGEHEMYVGNFYFMRDHFYPSTFRYAGVLQQYASLGYDELALFRLGESYFRVKMFVAAKDAFNRLMSAFPTSQFAGPAKERLEQLAQY